MDDKNSLTKGDVNMAMIKLSLPLIITALFQVAYNFVDIIYLGRLGTEVVAGAGIAFFIFYFAISISLIPKVGMGAIASRAFGSRNSYDAAKVIQNGLILGLILGLFYTLLVFLCSGLFIDAFNLSDQASYHAKQYLFYSGIGIALFIINPIISQAFIAIGQPLIPFIINSLGAIVNIILDPLMIFGLGNFEGLGVRGAALATGIGQLFIFLGFMVIIKRRDGILKDALKTNYFEYRWIKDIFKLGLPAALLSGFNYIVTIILNGYTSRFGDLALAVAAIGHQIESISFTTCDALQLGISAMVGQNYGAKNLKRLRKVIRASLNLTSLIGLISFSIMLSFRSTLMKLFIPNNLAAIDLGMTYLAIASIGQIFFAIESGSTGIYNGFMDPKTPSLVGLILNILKIPLSLILMNVLKVRGIWLAITISNTLKGLINLRLLSKKVNKELRMP